MSCSTTPKSSATGGIDMSVLWQVSAILLTIHPNNNQSKSIAMIVVSEVGDKTFLIGELVHCSGTPA